MKRFLTAIVSILGYAAAACAQGTPNESANGQAFTVHSAPVCPGPANVGTARCHAWVVTDAHGVPRATGIGSDKGNGHGPGGGGGGGGGGSAPPPPSGAYGPAQFQTAYGLIGATTGGATVAIVDAYDNPAIEQDLATYSKAYGLPECTTANGCFTKVSQTGGTSYPRADQGWALEIALDVQAVHAVCPDCKILLVEARSNSLSNLLVAVQYAASRADVVVVSNSWGAGEFSSEAAYDGYFNYGKPITVSSGDSGYGVEWPAASPVVTAVGGTTLTLNEDNTRKDETVWKGSGSGCSSYEQPSDFQANAGVDTVNCGHRIVADVAADADPATGAAVYDSYGYAGQSGWFIVGGTSLSSPIIAAVYALAGNTQDASVLYSNRSALFDVTQGFNGSCGSYLCMGATGYDGPTGLGTPGFNAF
jgi:subtilase family serine protease